MNLSDDDNHLPNFKPSAGQPDEEPSSAFQENDFDPQSVLEEGLTPIHLTNKDLYRNDGPNLDDDVAAFRRELSALKIPSSEQNPEEEPFIDRNQPSRRRRRSSKITDRLSASEMGAQLTSVIQKTSPSLDFFIYSFLCGCILGIGYILDTPAILLMGILVAPVLGPWVGTALSAATGEARVFRETFGGVLTSMTIVFVISVLAGYASRFFQPMTSSQALYHSHLWWPDLLMLVIGTASLIITFIHTDEKPIIPSLMVAYEIFLPFSAAGFGLGSNIQGLWPEAGLVFLIHFALSISIGLIIFFTLGFRPQEARGYALTASLILVGIVIMAGFAGFGNLINIRGDTVNPMITKTAPNPVSTRINPTIKPILAKSPATPTITPVQPSPTHPAITVTIAVTPSPNGTSTATLLPTPVYGRVQSDSGGVLVRYKPGGQSITTVQNGYLAQILGDTPVVLEGSTWIHVIIKTSARDIDGWVLKDRIETATPSFAP